MKNKRQKQAVIVIHGIGNQYPMDTARELVENLKNEDEIIYSGPDKESAFYETRRLRMSRRNTDFYEFYWANLIQEPRSLELYNWLLMLLFLKKPSNRVKKMVYTIRFGFFVAISLFLYALYHDLLFSFQRKIVYLGNVGLFSILAYIFVKFIVPSVNLKTASTIGDAVRYLSPSPQNIESRYKIRKKGLTMLKKLHDKKTESGEPFYSRIIIIGHSLGSVVGYDLITQFWHDYVYQFCPKTKNAVQPYLSKMSELINEKHRNKNNIDYIFPKDEFLELQRLLFDEIKSNGNEWLISDFLTIGSPLCHGHYIMAKNLEEFEKKSNYREFPLCPPKIDIKSNNNSIVKDYENSISFNINLNVADLDGFNGEIRVINHSSQFSFIRWTNMYFKNDFVGGNIGRIFGDGVVDIELKPKGNWLKRNLPFFSHTNYWDNDQEEALNIIKDVVFKPKANSASEEGQKDMEHKNVAKNTSEEVVLQ